MGVDCHAMLYAGDMLERRTELEDQFDAIYDKDSFGILGTTLTTLHVLEQEVYKSPMAGMQQHGHILRRRIHREMKGIET